MAATKLETAAKPRLTEAEFLRMPNDGRKLELVDGEVREAPAGHEHDAIGFNVGYLLMPYTRGRGVLAGAQAGFRMKSGNIRSPDVAFTRKERLPDGKPSKGFEAFAPDLCVEIISPSEDTEERKQKLHEYFDAGAEQVWHLFPGTQQVRVYASPDSPMDYGPTDILESPQLLPGFRCLVADLFKLE